MFKISQKKFTKLLSTLPVIDLDKAVLGRENPYWRKWIEHPTDDSYWEPADFLDKLTHLNIPVFHQSGWFDGDGIGTKLNYLRMADHQADQKLTLGPWGHTDTAERIYVDRDFGQNAIIDLQRDYLRWFDYWLKEIDNGVDKESLVNVFVMGANKWMQGSTYPLEITNFHKFYFSSAGSANTSEGDGKLTLSTPPKNSLPDRFSYDPSDPTPDLRIYEEPEGNEGKVRSVEARKQERQEHRRQISKQRQDILVYETDPLTEPLTIAGPISAVLYASSSASDTDWFVTLSEVDRVGNILQLVQGKIRARFRTSMKTPRLLEPNEVCEYRIDLWHTAITIPVGARLRVEVTSAAFPLFSRNLNTGGHNETETRYVTAQQTVYHDQNHPSHLLLPVLPEDRL